MWINILDEEIPKKHGQIYLLYLKYKVCFGHEITGNDTDTVTARWDNTTECFYEVKTGLEIDSSEIMEWWKDI